MNISQYTIKVRCPVCGGCGYVWRKRERCDCTRCDGTGEVDKTVNEIHSDGSRTHYPADHSKA